MNASKNKIIDLGKRGKFNLDNKLNELTGKEWLKFTKSWFILSPPMRKENEILHPAKFPEALAEDFIKFFTKKNGWVLDPFMGTASTLIAAASLGRYSVGIEINNKYYKISLKRIKKKSYENLTFPINGNSMNLKSLLEEQDLSTVQFDYSITSPPYWNQLERNSMRQKSRKEKGLDTQYSKNNLNDLGNVKSYEEFIELQGQIFDQVFDVMKLGGYLTIVTNNIYFKGKLYPLAFDTAISLTKRGAKSWVLKDEKIWLQNDKKLIALGINSAWVGNRHHHYCLIFRKENE